jgi:4-hydroxybenzoate polyprenyltransferase
VAKVTRSVATAVELTRVAMAFGAVADLLVIVVLSRSDSQYHYMPVAAMPLGQAMASATATAVGLFTFATALNDLLDARHDRIFSPGRPIASGRIGTLQAFSVALASLLLALVGAISFGPGAIFVAILVAGGSLFYNATAKHIPAFGFLTLGAIHAGSMLIPNDQFTFTLPACLAFTHAAAIALAIHLVSSKRPSLSTRAAWMVVVGSVVAVGTMAWFGMSRSGDAYWPTASPAWGWVVPLAAIAFAILVIARKIRRATSPTIAAEKVARYGALWQALYAAAWLFGCGEPMWGLGALLFAGVGFGVMTLLKELVGSSGHAITFRG